MSIETPKGQGCDIRSSGIVPPESELIFEIHILEVDGLPCDEDKLGKLARPVDPLGLGPGDFCHPWWLARVQPLGSLQRTMHDTIFGNCYLRKST